jgi:hypothetical protein
MFFYAVQIVFSLKKYLMLFETRHYYVDKQELKL